MKVVKEEPTVDTKGQPIKVGGQQLKSESKMNSAKTKRLKAEKEAANRRKKQRLKLLFTAILFSSVLHFVGCSYYISMTPIVLHIIFYLWSFMFAHWKKQRADKYWKRYEAKFGVMNKNGEIEIPKHVQMTHRKLIAQGKKIDVS